MSAPGREPVAATPDPAHPGHVLREYLPKALSLGEAAKRLGVTRQALSALVNARAGVSASMALRLEAALGTQADMWLGLQAAYDLWQARRHPPRVRRLSLARETDSKDATEAHAVPPVIAKVSDAIAALCERHAVRELSIFGSTLREDFDPGASDIDAAVTFGPPTGESLAQQYFDLKRGLEDLFARPVDLVEIDAMPDTRLKRIIARTKLPIYAKAA